MPTYRISYRWTKDGKEKGKHTIPFRETSDRRAREWARSFINGLQEANARHGLKYSPRRFVRIRIVKEEIPLWDEEEQLQ